jgi:2,3-diketo-5-methylthio-1-phosphopentane phosphatase
MSETRPRVYLLDVEGTVAPISLVTEQLFPYARARFAEFLRENSENPAVQADLALLPEENRTEMDPSAPRIDALDRSEDFRAPSFPLFSAERVGLRGSESRILDEQAERTAFRESALTYLIWLMDRDRKSTALKSLQGKIWKSGFESGQLKGTLFPDVPAAFARWAAHARVAIYSSGSVEAQRLLFRHSIYGDLTASIAGYFDTRTGPKTASASYQAIAAGLKVEPAEVLFFSDVVRELDPAREAGCQTRLVNRPGNVPVEDPRGHFLIGSFADTP